jgi:hypothetical protein
MGRVMMSREKITLALAAMMIIEPIAQVRAAEPTPAQIEACRSDAMRLCPAEVMTAILGNREPVHQCMVRNRKQVSKSCREAFK